MYRSHKLDLKYYLYYIRLNRTSLSRNNSGTNETKIQIDRDFSIKTQFCTRLVDAPMFQFIVENWNQFLDGIGWNWWLIMNEFEAKHRQSIQVQFELLKRISLLCQAKFLYTEI